MAPVRTKADFVARYEQGEFGNHSPTWNSVGEFWRYIQPRLCPEDKSKYHLRNRVAGDVTFYNLAPCYLVAKYLRLTREGYSPEQFYVSEMAPMHHELIQGEVMRWTNGLYLLYTFVPKPMREALAENNRVAEGIIALELLRQFMDAKSYHWLWHLLTAYPNHVVEFTTFDQEWGTVPGFNTIFWEVRAY